MKYIILIITSLFIGILNAQSIYKSSIDNGGASTTNGNIEILYTIGEVNVQERSAGDIALSEGFISSQLDIHIDPKLFLEGPYSSNNMFDDLRSTGNIPTTSPYADGITCNTSVFNVTGNNAIIDWVWYEIRDGGDSTIVIDSGSALLQVDGDVVGVDGTSLLPVNVPFGNYYVMLGHRNHLGIITASTVSLSGSIVSLDFTIDSAMVNGGTNGIKNMGDGYYALFAGDYNGDGQVQNTDKNAVKPLRGISGYNNGDIDMNSEVQNTDINNVLIPNIGKGEQYASRKLNAKRKTSTKDN